MHDRYLVYETRSVSSSVPLFVEFSIQLGMHIVHRFRRCLEFRYRFVSIIRIDLQVLLPAFIAYNHTEITFYVNRQTAHQQSPSITQTLKHNRMRLHTIEFSALAPHYQIGEHLKLNFMRLRNFDRFVGSILMALTHNLSTMFNRQATGYFMTIT